MSINRTSPFVTEAPISYSESQGTPPFDWWQFLDRAKNGVLDEEHFGQEHREAIQRATSWTTCACGNQCSVIPRNDSGSPEDEMLFSLGMNFCHEIEECDWSGAFQTLRDIEIRSAQLIAELQ